jgi:predicted HTH transcriptional regulator
VSAATDAEIVAYVRRNPGATCHQVAGALGELAALVSVKLRALRAAGKLTSEGKTKGTRWHVAGKVK